MFRRLDPVTTLPLERACRAFLESGVVTKTQGHIYTRRRTSIFNTPWYYFYMPIFDNSTTALHTVCTAHSPRHPPHTPGMLRHQSDCVFCVHQRGISSCQSPCLPCLPSPSCHRVLPSAPSPSCRLASEDARRLQNHKTHTKSSENR